MNSKTKKIISSILIAANLAIPANITLAKEESKTHSEVKVYFNDEKIEFDQQPIIVDGRTKVPFRAIFETMGTVVYYRESDSSILGITRDGDTIYHVVGTNKATINGVEKTFDSVSEIVNDRTLIPVRMVADLLSAEVEWKEKTQTVEIEKEIYTNDYHKKIRGILECTLDQNFNPEDFKRYLDYQYNNWDMDPKQVILDVNMDLDKELVMKTTTVKQLPGYSGELLDAKEEDITVIEDCTSYTALVNHFNRLPKDYKPENMRDANDVHRDHPSFLGNINYAKLRYIRTDIYENYRNMIMDQKEYCKSLFFCPEIAYQSYDELTNQLYRVSVPYGSGVYHYFGADPFTINDEITRYISGSYFLDLQTGLSFSFHDLYDNVEILEYKNYLGHDVDFPEYTTYYRNNELKWFQDNCHLYGFVLRYPEGKEHITRMVPHKTYFRYVGKDVAKIMHDENLCLEEYCAKYESKTSYKTDLESTKKKVLERY